MTPTKTPIRPRAFTQTADSAISWLASTTIADLYRKQILLLKSTNVYSTREADALLRALQKSIAHAVSASPFYREAVGWKLIHHLHEFSELPFTTKDDLKDQYPFGFLAAERDELIRYAESTGTSGRVSAGYATRDDWLENNLSVSLSWSTLLVPSDTLAIAVPYELTYVGADIDRVAELLQVSTISIGTNNRICSWTRLVDLLESYRVTAIVCAPTRAIRLAGLAREKGLNPVTELSVRKIICVGEALSDAKRALISRLWGATVYSHYGMTEAMAVAVPCVHQNLHLCDSRFYFEVIDPETLQPISDGAVGELVLTTLASRAMPLLRYRTGDLVRRELQTCDCENTGHVIKHLGRVSDYVMVNSEKVDFCQFDDVLLNEAGVEPYYSVAVQDQTAHVYLIARDGVDWPAVSSRIQNTIKTKFGLSTHLIVCEKSEWLQRMDNRSKPGSPMFRSHS